ncbi:hypothetical protein D3C81_1775040 [compost metagenome]
MSVNFSQRLGAAIDDDFQAGEILLELIGEFIAQRRDFAILFRAQALEDRIACMHDEGIATGIGNRADKVTHKIIRRNVIDTDPMLDGHIDRHCIAHRLDAIGDQ